MRSTVGSVQITVARHPRLVVTVLVVSAFLAAGSAAAALDGVSGFETTMLGGSEDVSTSGLGVGGGGPTDPETT